MEHDWHLFDAEKGYDVKQVDHPTHPWWVRHAGDYDTLLDLTPEEFNQWRSVGDNPRGLQ